MTRPAPGEQILEFGNALRNASREGIYADLILQMYRSGAWRRYATSAGLVEWRAHEFDYFLIACEAHHRDVQRILAWDTVRAAKLANAMVGAPGPPRRTIDEASAAWRPRSGLTLFALAQQNGWIPRDGTRVKPVISKRVMTRVQHGVTTEAHAQQVRQQQVRKGARASVLEARVAAILRQTPDPIELRYILDRLRRHLAQRGRPVGTSQRAQWKREIAAVNGDATKLAARWGTSPAATRQRMHRV